jgi:hypothetical protein
MRHDDRIRTAVVLAGKDAAEARAAAFRQLVDLSLQTQECGDSQLTRQGLRALVRLRSDVPAALLDAAIDKAARNGGGALHLRLFRHSKSGLYDKLLQTAKPSETEWWRFARSAPASVLAALLTRSDLPEPVRDLITVKCAGSTGADALFVPDASIAHSEAEIANRDRLAPPPASVEPDELSARTPALRSSANQIRELINRIAAFRARMGADGVNDGAGADLERTLDSAGASEQRWTWRCNEQGRFIECKGLAAPLNGKWLTQLVPVDGDDLLRRAVERRVPFRDLVVETENPDWLPGRWRLAGLPQFDRHNGRFTGYWGSGIRLDAPREAEGRAEGLFGTGASTEALSTMAHEVRTPLNAIIGFAQLIEGEVLGNAGETYRSQAGNILEHAQKLLGALDDLSDAARIEQGRFHVGHARFDVGGTLRGVLARYATLARDRGVDLIQMIAPDLPDIEGDASVLDRSMSRLITAALAAARAEEAIWIVAQRGETGLRIGVTRPLALNGFDVETLLSPAGVPLVGESDVPVLGIGFALKLVQSLVTAAGGRFDIGAHQFTIMLPAASAMENSEVS